MVVRFLRGGAVLSDNNGRAWETFACRVAAVFLRVYDFFIMIISRLASITGFQAHIQGVKSSFKSEDCVHGNHTRLTSNDVVIASIASQLQDGGKNPPTILLPVLNRALHVDGTPISAHQ